MVIFFNGAVLAAGFVPAIKGELPKAVFAIRRKQQLSLFQSSRRSPDALDHIIFSFSHQKACLPQFCNKAGSRRINNDCRNGLPSGQLLNALQILGVGTLSLLFSAAVIILSDPIGGCSIIAPQPSRKGVQRAVINGNIPFSLRMRQRFDMHRLVKHRVNQPFCNAPFAQDKAAIKHACIFCFYRSHILWVKRCIVFQ